MSGTSNPVILYDGVCGFCNRMVQFVLKRDRGDRFRFAPLQSEFARKLLEKHGRDGVALESVCFVANFGQPGEQVLTGSTASISVLRQLSGFWRVLSACFSVVPRPLRDFAYEVVARHRYRIFGKYDTCPLPKPQDRHKFLAVA